MVDLVVCSILSFTGAVLIDFHPALMLPGAIFALAMAVAQVGITRDYRRLGFIETGL